VSRIFREEALRRYAASRQYRDAIRDVPARLVVWLWICAGLLVAGLLWVGSDVSRLLR
jgi:hypothetical protein